MDKVGTKMTDEDGNKEPQEWNKIVKKLIKLWKNVKNWLKK